MLHLPWLELLQEPHHNHGEPHPQWCLCQDALWGVRDKIWSWGWIQVQFYKFFYLNWHAREQNLPILIVQSGLIDSGFFIKVLKFNGGSTHIRWILHMVLSEGQNRRQKTRQYPRQFATRARISIEESFLSVRVTRVRDKNQSTILRKAKMMSGLCFFFNVALKKYVIFCLLSMAVF